MGVTSEQQGAVRRIADITQLSNCMWIYMRNLHQAESKNAARGAACMDTRPAENSPSWF
jgi:hypothetical protein